MGIYTDILRPILFKFPPEQSHKIGQLILSSRQLWRLLGPMLSLQDPLLRTRLSTIDLPNPVGLAAGYDKNCDTLESLANIGFGYITGGTIVSKPRDGNPQPRILRVPTSEGMINSLGFPSDGLARVMDKVSSHNRLNVPLLLSISGISTEEIVECYITQDVCSAIELNISSPNTQGIRIFQNPGILKELLQTLQPIKTKPLLIKLPPFFGRIQTEDTYRIIDVCLDHGLDGFTVANTWPIENAGLAVGRGGLSGKPLFMHMLDMVKSIRNYVGNNVAINACGGISSGEDAVKALIAGANTVQLYTGFIYQGPRLIANINKYILDYMTERGIPSIESIALDANN
ncbi:MAG: dihydroorotate dehydrogenase (quinone) [Chloroflexi bacterium]|nr:dihydroorotate dehydrogenase (quinone) [Chloroflexota bacterium]